MGNGNLGNCPFWIETLICALRSISHASLPSSFKNKEEIMNSDKDVICANEKEIF